METSKSQAVATIKVVGVGGCGCNAIDHMMARTIQGVEFISINTDIQALNLSTAPKKIQIGIEQTRGLGAGANPDMGRNSACESRESIIDALKGADMIFLAAGMGGGTGTGAAPVVAEIAKELGILTVAVVTKPFMFEGPKKMKAADEGLGELRKNVDSLIIIPNEKISDVLGEDIPMVDAFRAVNGVLHNAVAGIAEVINCPGHINVDFADVRTIMGEMGMAMMGTSVAEGEGRAIIAAQAAVSSPLLDNNTLNGAKGILVNITGSSNVRMREINDIMNTIQSNATPDATIILGQVIDESMGDNIRVTLIATGLESITAARFSQRHSQTTPMFVKEDPMVPVLSEPSDDYDKYDMPAVQRNGGSRRGRSLGIPTFLTRNDNN